MWYKEMEEEGEGKGGGGVARVKLRGRHTFSLLVKGSMAVAAAAQGVLVILSLFLSFFNSETRRNSITLRCASHRCTGVRRGYLCVCVY